jgi:GTP cyclohydrolase II
MRRQFNLNTNNFIKETTFGINSISIFPLSDLSQDNVEENRHQERREKEVQILSQKLNNQILKSLSVTSGNKRIEYFLKENIIVKGSISLIKEKYKGQ